MKTDSMRDELIQLGGGAHALATQILGNPEDARDAVQDAFAAVLGRPGAYDAKKSSLRTWFFRLVRNRCIDILRRRRPQGLVADETADAAAGPEATAETSQRDDALRSALQSLEAEQRQIIVLRDYLDLSYAEIGLVRHSGKHTENAMTNHRPSESHVDELLSGYIDGELTQRERQSVSLHCEACPECRSKLAELQALRTRIGETQLTDLGQDIWREHMNDTTVNASRGIGWLLFIGGLLLAAGFAVYEFVKEMNSMPLIVMLIIVGIYGGLLLLFVSVLRQRLIERKSDKYEDVEI
jgi:RNA polymerase sigma factor (sigma-70 family)